MANKYLRAGAAGTGTGDDWTNAYTSLATLETNLARGDTGYVAAGAYAGTTFNTAASGTTLITIKRAIIADHGTSTGWSDSYDGQATFSSQFLFTTPYWIVNGQTGGGAENLYTGSFGFKVTETDDADAVLKFNGTAGHITVTNIDLVGKGSASTDGGSASNDGVAIYDCTDITIGNYRMTGIGRCPFFVSAQNFIAENGYVVSFFGSVSVHSEIASVWSFSGNVGDNTFRNNLFVDCQSTGGIMWDNQDNTAAVCRVYGNTFYRPSGATWEGNNGVVGGWTGGAGEQCRNLLVYNNTFINVNIDCLGTLPGTFSGNNAYNNIFYNCDSPAFTIYAAHNYNFFINSGGSHSEANAQTTPTTDPFTDYVGLDFTLVANTNAGNNLGSPYNVDPLGNTRTTWSRGAFEFEDAPIGTTLNVTNLNVTNLTIG